MQSIYIPKLNLSFSVDLEIEYDPFKGKTKDEFIKHIESELQDVLFDVSPSIKNVYTSLIAIDENDKQI